MGVKPRKIIPVLTSLILYNFPRTLHYSHSLVHSILNCDRLCINHPSAAFNQILFFMSFSSPIYGDYIGIFIRVTLQNLWAPVRNRSGLFHFEISVFFRTLQLLRATVHKSCGRINARCECNAGRSGDMRSGLTRDYSKKLSSKETTRFDEENQAFLTADCGRLQVLFTSPHSLSVNGSIASLLEKLYAVGAWYCGTR